MAKKLKKFKVLFKVSHLEESTVYAEDFEMAAYEWQHTDTESEFVKDLIPEIVDVEEVTKKEKK